MLKQDYNHKQENKKKKDKNEIVNSLIELNFPSFTKKIKQTRNGLFLIGYGEYPPQIRCFDLNNFSLKFQRSVNHQIVDFQIISENWEKLALLKLNKFIEFHSKSGYYYQIKIPKTGFSVIFDIESRTLYISSIDGEIFRLNLELGKFSSSIKSRSKYINTSAAKNFQGNLFSLGNSKGMIEIWDLRVPQKPISVLNSLFYLKKKINNQVTYLTFCETTNYKFYSGFSSGEILFYDLRNLTPLISKNLGNNSPIKTIKKNQETNLMLSANENIIKIWNDTNGKTLEYIKIKNRINHICMMRKTGFIFIATASPNIESRYIPLLGSIPTWSFFPDYYKDKKFLTKNKKSMYIKSEKKIK